MGDHFVLLVDRLLTESTLEAALESRNLSQQKAGPPIGVETATLTDISSDKMDFIPGKLVECRICQDEDHDSKMETPCSCCGSLKYAHRRCVQRWCNEKGDTICEICHQPFKPVYTAPPPLFHYGGIPMSFRGNWEIPRRELYNPRFIAMVSTDRSFLDGDYDGYSSPTSRSLTCCRTVAIIFVVLLVLRHALPIIISETEDYSFTVFMLLLLRISGMLLPIYLTIKAVTAILRRRHPHEPHDLSYSTSSGEEDEQTHLQPQQHLIHVH